MDFMLIKTGTMYRVNTEVEEMKSILDAERSGSWPFEDALFKKLEKIRGVNSVEYDGHFGPAVYFNVESESDTHAVGQRILAKVSLHIKACKKFNMRQAKK